MNLTEEIKQHTWYYTDSIIREAGRAKWHYDEPKKAIESFQEIIAFAQKAIDVLQKED